MAAIPAPVVIPELVRTPWQLLVEANGVYDARRLKRDTLLAERDSAQLALAAAEVRLVKAEEKLRAASTICDDAVALYQAR